MNDTWAKIYEIASSTIGPVSLFISVLSYITARRSSRVSAKTGQAAYEATKTAQNPVVSLFLNQVTHRRPTSRYTKGIVGVEAQISATKWDADSLEVLIRGRLVNNTSHDALLSCYDHPKSGRTVRYSYRNQSVFIIDGIECMEAMIPPDGEMTFTWIDRRPKKNWINIYNLHAKNSFNDPDLQIPQLRLREAIYALLHNNPLHEAKFDKVERSGFRLVCESRSAERVATVWYAEVTKPPVEVAGRDDDDRIVFKERRETIQGPIDDSVVFYRVSHDPTLALISPPRWLHVPGRF